MLTVMLAVVFFFVDILYQIEEVPLGWEDPLEEGMATHCSILAWRIPGTGEPGGLLSMGSHRVRYDWSDLAAAAKTARMRTILREKRICHLEICLFDIVIVVQSLSCVWLFAIPWTAAHQASLSFTISQGLLKLMSAESVMLVSRLNKQLHIY